MYVCLCKGITDHQIRNAVEDGARNMHQMRNALGVSTQCGMCAGQVKSIMNESLKEEELPNNLFYQLA